MIRFAAVLVPFLCLSAPVSAQSVPAPACADATSIRLCLVDEAMALAGASLDGGFYVQEMLEIATFVEESGSVPDADLARVYFDHLDRRVPLTRILRSVFRGPVCSVIPQWQLGPVMAAQMADWMAKMEPATTAEDRRFQDDGLDATPARLRCKARAGDLQAVLGLLADAPERAGERVVSAAVVFAVAGHEQAVRSLREAYPDADWSSYTWFWPFRHAVDVGDLDAVMRLLEANSDDDRSLDRIGFAYDRMDDADHRARLRALLETEAASRPGPLFRYVFDDLADAPARAGDWDATLALIARLEPAASNAEFTSQALAKLAGTTGTYDIIPDIVAQVEAIGSRSLPQQLLKTRIYAAAFETGIAAGRDDIALIAAEAGAGDRTLALAALGSALAKAGDLPGALSVVATLSAEKTKVGEVKRFVSDLAMALAEAGRWEDAGGYARQLDDPALLARIAVHAPH